MDLLYADGGRRLGPVDADRLRELYRFPPGRWVRANFVSTLDGAATGLDHRTDSINTPPDNRVFALNRSLCDAIVVGAGTVRAEGYGPVSRKETGDTPLLVAVTRSADVPPRLTVTGDTGEVVVVTCEAAGRERIEAARRLVGAPALWVLGEDEVDLAALVDRLADQGYRSVLTEGGPTFFSSLLAAGLVDDVALTWTPLVVGGDLTRITRGDGLAVELSLTLLLEEDHTLMGLWRVQPSGAGLSARG